MPDGSIPAFDLSSRLRIRIHPRARRISLRVDIREGCVFLVRPKRASDALVAAFVAEKRRWIETQLAKLPQPVTLRDGMALNVLDGEYRIQSRPAGRGGVWMEDNVIAVSGAPEHLPRRLKDFLKAEARKHFADWARGFAAQLGVKVTRVSVRDTTSRWGSCTRDGRLSLSWRLMMAPRDVAAYVVAHEVAHLKHMNHSAAFWRTVEALVGDMKKPRAWLRAHGAGLHRVF